MTDWAGWGTSIGTLVLAGATFASIRSSNRSARIAERSLLAGQRPLLVAARREDPAQEIQFADGRVLDNPSTQALFLHDDDVIYLAIPLRNAGAGIAHLQGYRLDPNPPTACKPTRSAPPDTAAGPRPPTRRRLLNNSATSTSLRATPASGKPPCATRRARPTPQRNGPTTPAAASPSTCSTATSKTDNRPSPASCCSRPRLTHGAATPHITGAPPPTTELTSAQRSR